MKLYGLIFWIAAMPALAAASPQPEANATFGPVSAQKRLLVRSTTDIALFAPLLRAFLTQASDLHIKYEQWNSYDL